jgi:hypothetical protein
MTAILDGDLTILVGGAELTGWQRVELEFSVERYPRHCIIRMTDRDPGKITAVVAQFGSDLIPENLITEFVGIGVGKADIAIPIGGAMLSCATNNPEQKRRRANNAHLLTGYCDVVEPRTTNPGIRSIVASMSAIAVAAAATGARPIGMTYGRTT